MYEHSQKSDDNVLLPFGQHKRIEIFYFVYHPCTKKVKFIGHKTSLRRVLIYRKIILAQ